MKQQIIVSGTGGQGILFLTRFFAEAAMIMQFQVLTSEIHGMAMRGGTVVSHVKVGPFKSPLVREGQADAGLILSKQNVELHRGLVKSDGSVFVNTDIPGDYFAIDASGLAFRAGAPAMTNLVLLGFALGKKGFFCDADVARKVLTKISPPAQLKPNLKGLDMGLASG
jgi:indolepyruvate ferredoxin oxidoreductase beta subunit